MRLEERLNPVSAARLMHRGEQDAADDLLSGEPMKNFNVIRCEGGGEQQTPRSSSRCGPRTVWSTRVLGHCICTCSTRAKGCPMG